MKEQELKKSVDDVVSKILETQPAATEAKPAEEVAKAITSESVSAPIATQVAPMQIESNPANNGGAVQMIADPSAPVAAVAKSEKDEDAEKHPDSEEKEDEDAKKAKKAKMKKSEDADEDDEEDKDEKDPEEKADKAKKAKMKKSLEELSESLDEEELELIKAWREESEKEEQIAKAIEATPAPAAPAQPNIEEVLKKALSEHSADLRKALEEKDTLIKSLSDKVEKMASQPAYDRRSISNLEAIEKSGPTGPQSTEIKKSQVLDTMLNLQAEGKGITSHHIAEFEATGNISDGRVKRIVFQELKLN